MLAGENAYEADHGPRKAAAGTERLCAATREIKPIEEMIRFVLGPDGTVVPDLKRKLPGRGVWITARRAILADAVRRGAFRRGFKAETAVSKDLPLAVERLLEQSVLDALAIARKAGQVVSGFTKVETAIASQRPVAVLHARDASEDGCRKVAAAIKRRFSEDAEKIVTMSTFTSTQLDLALGRPNVVHAALLAGRASDTVLARWLVLDRFRTADPGEGTCSRRHDGDTQNSGLE